MFVLFYSCTRNHYVIQHNTAIDHNRISSPYPIPSYGICRDCFFKRVIRWQGARFHCKNTIFLGILQIEMVKKTYYLSWWGRIGKSEAFDHSGCGRSQGPPQQSIRCVSKCFTNGRLRIDFFQPRCRLRGNNAIMGHFDKWLIIKRLRF